MDKGASTLNRSAVGAASLGGLLFGFDTAVIAGVTDALRHSFHLSPAQLGAAVSAALVGTLVGALGAGPPGDRFGSRTMLYWIAGAYILSAIGSAAADGLAMLVAFRFIGGLAIGGSSVLAPVYIAEVSPAERRGALVGLFQLSIVIGILAAYVSNFLIARAIDGELAWRVKLAVAAAPALLFLLLLLRIPHSPRWLAQRGRLAEAGNAIRTLRMGDPETLLTQFSAASVPGSAARLSWTLHRRPILLAFALALFNQLSGINAILYYLGDIFAAAGFSAVSADLQAVAIGVANLLATLLGLAVIDQVGRKLLLLIGAIGTALALAAVATIYTLGQGQMFLLPALIAFILFFAVSQGAVIWVYLSEIFPTAVRARGQAIGSATHWGMNALLAFGFPIVAQYTQALPFWLFAGAMLVQFVIVWRYFPETRGISLERLEGTLEGK
ncbi:sugar porter (SP) family MFS transporter [Sphingomonas kyeonggiensis]|uniref:Sugar porter (SP) family MFS transporter n=1 Tax=Sphingomonas kyeonggiensis TaxID=1268553 RepID=A0A7W7NT72_9SPHN|nr:sugar porter family MFS transporter [Sphingomonas kyeonggiensis]MBB4839581.1 sugar porter (SP) family MFS transporter [Sphingomonas kyeonggiensis]